MRNRRSLFHLCWKILVMVSLLVGWFPVVPAPEAEAAPGDLNKGYQYPSEDGVKTPNTHGIITGEVVKIGGDYVIVGSQDVQITGLDPSGDKFYVIISDITVERFGYNDDVLQSRTGKALHFSVKDRHADNGYVLVDRTEASQWIKVFNGDEAYVFSGGVVRAYTVLVPGVGSYIAYNLAEIAAACGGAGGDYGFTPASDGKYQKYNKFKASVRPSGQVSTDRPTYSVGDTVRIFPVARDYSFYDKGVYVHNLYVKNLNGTEQKQLFAAPGTPQGAPWQPQNITFNPTQVGTYEVGLIFTDRHDRTVDGSPDMSTSRTITTTFQVLAAGAPCDPAVSPLKATLKISGQSDKQLPSGGDYELPEGKNSFTLVFPVAGNLKVNGVDYGSTGTTFNLTIGGKTPVYFESMDGTQCWAKDFIPPTAQEPDCENSTAKLRFLSDKTETQLQSGPPAYYLKRDDRGFRFEASKTGTFYFSTGGDWVLAVTNTTWYEPLSVVTGQPFKVKFVSKDGTICWEKQFFWEGVESCPVVWKDMVGSEQISSGETIRLRFGDSLDLHATYNDGENPRAPAAVYWVIKKPNGQIYKYRPTYDFDHKDQKKWYYVADWNLRIPNPYEDDSYPSEYRFAFDQAGRYEIWHEYTFSYDFDDCSWKAYIEVSPFDCADISIGIKYTNLPITRNPDGSYKLQLATGTDHAVHFELKYRGSKHKDLVGDWVLKQGSTVVARSQERQESFYHYFPVHDQSATYTLEVTAYLYGKTCRLVVIIEIAQEEFSCDQISFEAEVDGEQTELERNGSNLVLFLDLGGERRVKLRLKHPGPQGSIQRIAWTLVEDSTGAERKYVYNDETFSYNFPRNLLTYTLTVEVTSVDGVECVKVIKIRPDEANCDRVEVKLHINDTEVTPISGNGTASNPYRLYLWEGKHPYAVVKGWSYYRGKAVDANWLLKQGNWLYDDAYGVSEYYSGAIFGEKGDVFRLFVQVNLNGVECEKVFELEFGDPPPWGPSDPSKDCSQVYLHFYDSQNQQWMHNVAGKTIRIQADLLGYLAVFVTTSPTEHVDSPTSEGLTADFTGSTRANEFPEFGIYYISNVTPGTYQIRATVTQTDWPACTNTLTVVIEPGGGIEPPGGDVDGGEIRIRVYDSDNRLLTSTADGVWEREPARIEVLIDQNRINAAFAAIDEEIRSAVEAKRAELMARYPSPAYEDVTVTVQPASWDSRTSPLTQWPSSLSLSVSGPGVDQNFALSPRLATQSHVYSGTTVPTQTTWKAVLNGEHYRARVDGFSIAVPYQISFVVAYRQCESPGSGEAEERTCTSGSDTDAIANTYHIRVAGDDTSFEVFEPNARGLIAHTAEWTEYHSRDRYPNSQPDDFYAGERILARVQLEARHKHPFSGKYPRIEAAEAWISERGRQSALLQNRLALVQESPVLWKGPQQPVDKLGMREAGVDTPLMGDKQQGFQKGSRYAVHFTVRFAFGVQKGFEYPQKASGAGHPLDDYRVWFDIIANAWERQGIRNRTSH